MRKRRNIIVKATVYVTVDLEAYEREYGETPTVADVRADVKERVEWAATENMRPLSSVFGVEQNVYKGY